MEFKKEEQVAIRKKLQEIKNEAQQCGEKFPIHRPPCKLRKRKHPKHIWCTRCLKVTKHLKI